MILHRNTGYRKEDSKVFSREKEKKDIEKLNYDTTKFTNLVKLRDKGGSLSHRDSKNQHADKCQLHIVC